MTGQQSKTNAQHYMVSETLSRIKRITQRTRIRNADTACSAPRNGCHPWQSAIRKFKKHGCHQSYTVEGYQCKVEGKPIKLPKIGWVKMFSALRFEGRLKRVTLSRTAQRWFVVITVDTGLPNVPRETRGLPVVGVDVGINTLATLDTAQLTITPDPLKRYERKLKRAQRSLSKKTFLSQNWYKQKRKVERLHYRMACIREDAHHQASTDIVMSASAIGIETL